MSGTRHTLTAVLSAALHLTLSFGLTADLVFCTAASGHVAVESAYSADCCDTHVLPDGVRRLSGDEGCGCVDTPIGESLAAARQRQQYAPPSPASRLPPVISGSYLAASLPQSIAAPTSRSGAASSALTVRRSVVLLV